MHRFAYSTPVLPGHDARELVAVFEGRDGDYLRSRQRLGILTERLYATPSALVTYLETDWDFATTLRGQAVSDLKLDSEFRDRFWQVHGVELEERGARPAPRPLGEWLDPAVTKRRSGIAFGALLLPATAGEAVQLGEDVFHHRRYENTLSRRALGLTVERIFLDGQLLVFYLEGDDPAAAYHRLAESETVHDEWFKATCRGLLADEGFPVSQLAETETIWDRDLTAVVA